MEVTPEQTDKRLRQEHILRGVAGRNLTPERKIPRSALLTGPKKQIDHSVTLAGQSGAENTQETKV